MLEFIVLGQVPGTNFQITFNLIRGLLLLLLALLLIKLDMKLYHNPKAYKLTSETSRYRILNYTVQEFQKWLSVRYSRMAKVIQKALRWLTYRFMSASRLAGRAIDKLAKRIGTLLLYLIRKLGKYVHRQSIKLWHAFKTKVLPEAYRSCSKAVKHIRAATVQTAKRLRLWYLERRTT